MNSFIDDVDDFFNNLDDWLSKNVDFNNDGDYYEELALALGAGGIIMAFIPGLGAMAIGYSGTGFVWAVIDYADSFGTTGSEPSQH